MTSTPNHLNKISSSLSLSSVMAPALVLSNSEKRIDQTGKKKYVKQVTRHHPDTELHLVAQMGDLVAVKQILGDIDLQIKGTFSGNDVNSDIVEVRASIVNEENELGDDSLKNLNFPHYISFYKKFKCMYGNLSKFTCARAYGKAKYILAALSL